MMVLEFVAVVVAFAVADGGAVAAMT